MYDEPYPPSDFTGLPADNLLDVVAGFRNEINTLEPIVTLNARLLALAKMGLKRAEAALAIELEKKTA